VDNDGLRIIPGATSTNRNLLIAIPTNGVAGSTAITLQADDQQSSNTVSFVLNVQPPDFAPSGNSVVVEEPFQPIWGDFNGDGLLDLVASTRQIYTNAGNGAFSAGIPCRLAFSLRARPPLISTATATWICFFMGPAPRGSFATVADQSRVFRKSRSPGLPRPFLPDGFNGRIWTGMALWIS